MLAANFKQIDILDQYIEIEIANKLLKFPPQARFVSLPTESLTSFRDRSPTGGQRHGDGDGLA